ncbi:MAG: DNA primase catalytic subunit PriS [archaeon]|nr:DNA primase catalytic subunit PriS [archaeon]
MDQSEDEMLKNLTVEDLIEGEELAKKQIEESQREKSQSRSQRKSEEKKEEKKEQKKKEQNATAKKDPSSPTITKQMLKTYYDKYFPFELFEIFLANGKKDEFERREFSFTSERYFRFQCFGNWEEFKKKVLVVLPEKIDVGAVYNVLPSNHGLVSTDPNAFIPVKKEIVFDIDLTDYDDVRTCCKDAKVCNKCWKFMIIAYYILKQFLEIDFGYKKILWVFSGRRGIHCWVCDERARISPDKVRSAVAEFIKYNMANLKMNVSAGLRGAIHPSFLRSIKIIQEHFNEYILEGQDILNSQKGKELLTGLIKAYFTSKQTKVPALIKRLETTILDLNMPSTSKMERIKDELEKFETNEKIKKFGKFTKTERCLMDYMMNIMYPRLDINVSKHLNHLLKSPFCVHPKTGMVCVPLSEENIKNFKVEDIPNIFDIIKDDQAG